MPATHSADRSVPSTTRQSPDSGAADDYDRTGRHRCGAPTPPWVVEGPGGVLPARVARIW